MTLSAEQTLDLYRETGALLEGHFLLSSGLHSPMYLQSARVLMHPDKAERLCRALAAKIAAAADGIDVVVSPAMGGVIVGYETARHLGVPAMFTERVDGLFAFRRGFALEPGQRVVMVEDIVTTGKSSRECIDCIRAHGGEVVAGACLVDRSAGKADIGVPLISLAGLEVPAYAEDALPPELASIPAVKPGSRGLA